MSLLKLLAEYPNYSARKVRRLAGQLNWLDGFNGPLFSGISQDLMDFNLLRAKQDDALNDDLKSAAAEGLENRPLSNLQAPVPQVSTPFLDKFWGDVIRHTDVVEAQGEINEMRVDWTKLSILLGYDQHQPTEVILQDVANMVSDWKRERHLP